MDRSLLFFYSFMGFFIIYFGIRFVKDEYKWHSLLFVSSVVASLIISSCFLRPVTGEWLLLVAVLTFVVLFSIALLIVMMKQCSMRRHVRKKITLLQSLSPEDFVKDLIAEHDRKQWYVLYLPSDNKIEIGFNLFDANPVIGKKFDVKTLSGRYFYFIAQCGLQEPGLKNDSLYSLGDFYVIDNQAKKLVHDYLNRIKSGHKNPGIINEDSVEA
ncbi:hypothetical protein LZ633_07740 [Enterobacter asburiae]|jgi:hypothetical protein|nr:hypothetical protein [Enterobacter asburiae]